MTAIFSGVAAVAFAFAATRSWGRWLPLGAALLFLYFAWRGGHAQTVPGGWNGDVWAATAAIVAG